MSTTITASISPRILSKAAHMFSNRLDDIFIELFQNARRAGATRIDVVTHTTPENETSITVSDNGTGIKDFSSLLCFGGSNWDAITEQAEDPAGMGFFSLLHSGATVSSNGQRVVLSSKAFDGSGSAQVTDTGLPQKGTSIQFVRKESRALVHGPVLLCAKYCPIEVFIDGAAAPREDFLKDALYVKETMGVRIGVFTSDMTIFRQNWNFHGRTFMTDIKQLSLHRVLPYPGDVDIKRDFFAKIDVIDSSSVHLKLPDRNGIVYDDQYAKIIKEARRTLLEHLATYPEHTASYNLFLEAHALGVELREASPYFEVYHTKAGDDVVTENGPFIGENKYFRLPKSGDFSGFAIVDRSLSVCNPDLLFTFEIAVSGRIDVPVLLADNTDYVGYPWYETLQRTCPTGLIVDGKEVETTAPKDNYRDRKVLVVSDKISLEVTLIDASGLGKSFVWDVPFACWRDYGSNRENVEVMITRSSPWYMKNGQPIAFDIIDAAFYIAFCYDDGNSGDYNTQEEYYRNSLEEKIAVILGGPMALVNLALEKAASDLNYVYNQAFESAGVTRAVFLKDEKGTWRFSTETGPTPS